MALFDSEQTTTANRPGLVYVISAWYAFTSLSGVTFAILSLSGALSLPAEQRNQLARLSLVDYSLSFLILGTLLVAAVALYFLRRVAFTLFAAAFAISLLTLIRNLLTTGQVVASGALGSFGYFFGLAILLAAMLYARRLTVTRQLR